MSRIGIVGLGLIGGSLGLDLRAQGHEILGIARRRTTCDRALERGIADWAGTELNRLSNVEILFLCTPIAAILPTLEQVRPHLHPDTLVTDVASVKAPIVTAATPLWPYFLGGHPMAGTEQQGVEAAQTHLFQNAPYVLTPTATTPPELTIILTSLIQQLQAQRYCCAPEAHDRAVASISHLPVIISASLIASCQQSLDAETQALAQALASSGFRDTSRVGGGNPELGVMMARYNRAALQAALDSYRESLAALSDQIEQEDWDALTAALQQTQAARPPFVE
ncbi:MAG: prephenate/arogenate dehydrogenase [Cyanobacteria bacterium P01_G01_bin.54]